MARGVPGSGPNAGGLSAGVAFVDIMPNVKMFAAKLTAGMSGTRKAAIGGGFLVGGAILAGIGSALKQGLQEEMQEQVAKAGLSNALSAAVKRGVDVGVTVEGVTKIADELQREAGIADDATIASASWLATFHNLLPDQKTFDRALRGVADLAAQQAIARQGSIDLGTAQNLLAKALQDPAKGLTLLWRAGVTFTKKQKETIKKLAETGHVAEAQRLIMEELEGQVGGAAKAYGETLPGKADRTEKAFGEMKQSIAVGLVPVMEIMADKLDQIAQFLARNPALVKALAIGFGVLAVAMIAGATAAALMNLAFLASPIGLIALAVIALAVAFVLAWRRSETFRNVVTTAFNTIWAVVGPIIRFIGDHWLLMLGVLTGGLIPVVIKVVQSWASIKGAVTSVVNGIKRAWNGVVDFVSGLPGRISAAASGMWNGILDAFRSVINTIVGFWNGLHFHIPGFDPPGPGPKFGGVDIGVPKLPYLAKGGELAPGQWGVVGERGMELIRGGRGGTSVIPFGSGRRMALTITNWRDGTGYIEAIADGLDGAHAEHAQQTGRMSR